MCESHPSDSQLKRETSAFQGTIPSKDQAANQDEKASNLTPTLSLRRGCRLQIGVTFQTRDREHGQGVTGTAGS